MLRPLMVASTLLTILGNACISEPTFDVLAARPPSGSATGTADPEMVRVPATTLGGAGIEPAAHKREHKPKKGKDAGSGKRPEPDSSSSSSSSSSSGGDDRDTTVVPAFWLDTHETSVSDYETCVAAAACSAADRGPGCTSAAEGLRDHPVTCVTRDQAADFCAWKKKRLVRLEEWLAATRGGAGRQYPWGAAAPSAERLNACGAECGSPSMYPSSDRFASTAPRGSFPQGRSPEGAHDLAGNVAEWIDDAPGGVAGGSYADNDASMVAAGATRTVGIDAKEPVIGFRCARD